MYANSKTAQQFYGVSSQTLRRWADTKEIKFYTTKGGHMYIMKRDKKKIDSSQISN